MDGLITMRGMHTLPVIAARLLAPGLGVALALLTLEGASRWYYDYRWVRDPAFGLVVPAGHTVRSRLEGAGSAHFETRGVRRAAALGPRRGVRILSVGDSFTEAYQVRDSDVYTTLVEEKLRSAGVPSAVLNFGRSGWSAADVIAESGVLRDTFQPAWTVIQVHDVDLGADAWTHGKTRFTRRCDGCAVEIVRRDPLAESTVRRRWAWLPDESALVWFGKNRYGLLRRILRLDAGREPAPRGREPNTPFGTTYPVAEELRMLSAAYDGRLTLLLLGEFDPANPDRDTDGEAAIKQAARELGISMACSRDEYPGLAARGIAPYGFSNTALNRGHLNAAGHAAAARSLARELLRLHAAGRL